MISYETLELFARICGDEGETLVALAVTKAGHHFRQNSGLDFGVDGRIKILCEKADGKAVASGG